MAKKARESKVDFRPHFKTHQSAEIGAWFRDEGITKITVSSVKMAQYFSEHGWNDITIAFHYNPLAREEIAVLAEKISLNILIESEEALTHVNKNIDANIGYFIKIDVGTGRTGISKDRFGEIPSLAKSKNKKHHFKGFLAHAGHSYKKINRSEAEAIYGESIEILKEAQRTINTKVTFSYGDTPTCSLLDSFPDIDEIRPGNFAFYDFMQYSFGTCGLEDIAVCMVCPVVSIHSDRNEAVVYGGAVHFSKDQLLENLAPFGIVVPLHKKGWGPKPEARLIRLSQEHGIVGGSPKFISSLKIGDLLGILPVHSCLTANLQQSYLSLDGQEIPKIN